MSDRQELSDQRLLDDYRTGHSPAARKLYDRYARRLYGFVRRRLGTDIQRRVGPGDVVQSTFRTFFRRAGEGSYDVPDYGELWQLLRTIASNKLINQGLHHRAAKRDVGKTKYYDPESLYGVPGTRQEDIDVRLLVAELLEDLTTRECEIIHLRIAGHEVAEIAARTHSSKRTTERVLQQFRRRLGDQLR